MSDAAAKLNERFALGPQLQFADGPGGLMVARIENARCRAVISLSGGHVMSWAPAGHSPVLWLSEHAKFAAGKSIRGGVPICWPWFGPHASDAKLPSHGFARTAAWTVERCVASPDGDVQVTLALPPGDGGHERTTAQVVVSLGTELRIDLITRNSSSSPAVIGEALHTYFAVSDVRKSRITGLDGCHYLDKVDAGGRKVQRGDISIGSEVDRVYINTTSECAIEDPGMSRRIRIRKSGSRSTVVWNPWTDKAAKMGDFGSDGFLRMVCVESGNANENVVTVEPGSEHILSVRYSVEPLA